MVVRIWLGPQKCLETVKPLVAILNFAAPNFAAFNFAAPNLVVLPLSKTICT
jgi:hypothetical protein